MKNYYIFIIVATLLALVSCKGQSTTESKSFAKNIDGMYSVYYCTKEERQFVTDETEDFGSIEVTKIEGGINIEAKGDVQRVIPMSTASFSQTDNANIFIYPSSLGSYSATIIDNEIELRIKMIYDYNRTKTFVVKAKK